MDQDRRRLAGPRPPSPRGRHPPAPHRRPGHQHRRGPLPITARVTSHTFRKTVATRLEEAGISARQVADQLGHRNPSMTTDVYTGRKTTVAAAATILARPSTHDPESP